MADVPVSPAISPGKTPGGQLNIPALLARVPLFSDLTPEEILLIAAGTRELNVPRGDVIFHKGDRVEGIHLVLYGQIKLAFTSPGGSEKVVEIVSPGQTFGEAVMFMDRPYPVFAQALVDARLLLISRQAIFAELERDHRLGRKMLAGLSVRLHQLVADVESYSLQSGRERIIGFLLREIPEQEEDILAGGLTHTPTPTPITVTLSTSKGTLASRLNLTQEHFSRILHDLSEEGLIRVEGRHIHIPDLERLRQRD